MWLYTHCRVSSVIRAELILVTPQTLPLPSVIRNSVSHTTMTQFLQNTLGSHKELDFWLKDFAKLLGTETNARKRCRLF